MERNRKSLVKKAEPSFSPDSTVRARWALKPWWLWPVRGFRTSTPFVWLATRNRESAVNVGSQLGLSSFFSHSKEAAATSQTPKQGPSGALPARANNVESGEKAANVMDPRSLNFSKSQCHFWRLAKSPWRFFPWATSQSSMPSFCKKTARVAPSGEKNIFGIASVEGRKRCV